ncbi:MAG: hypothetical protein LBT79_04130, partial [Elusimicrobiota bacterium]|nr:hypothetical protein [Elusimicrobiota bacterium]
EDTIKQEIHAGAYGLLALVMEVFKIVGKKMDIEDYKNLASAIASFTGGKAGEYLKPLRSNIRDFLEFYAGRLAKTTGIFADKSAEEIIRIFELVEIHGTKALHDWMFSHRDFTLKMILRESQMEDSIPMRIWKVSKDIALKATNEENSARLILLWDGNKKRGVEEAIGLEGAIGNMGFRVASIQTVLDEPKANEGWMMAEGAWNEGNKKVKMYYKKRNDGIIRLAFHLVYGYGFGDIVDLLQGALKEGRILEGLKLNGNKIEQIIIVRDNDGIGALKAKIIEGNSITTPSIIQPAGYQELLNAA